MTLRGKAMLSAAFALLTTALLLGQRDLVHVAFLVALLPALALAGVMRTRGSLMGSRSVSPRRLHAGESAQVSVVIRNDSLVPSGTMLIEDEVSGQVPRRFVVDRIGSHGRRVLRYSITATTRGVLSVGPMTAELVDPFGLAGLTRVFRNRESLIVLPTIVDLPTRSLAGRRTGMGEGSAHAQTAGGEDDVIPRPYRVGDELRRIHWRATARTGELMVRREEQPWRTSATIIMDVRTNAHVCTANEPTPQTSSFEWVVAAAASIASHLIRRGVAVHLTDTSGDEIADAQDIHGHDAAQLELARLQLRAPYRVSVGMESSREHTDTVVIALVAPMDHNDAHTIASVRRGRPGIAIVVDSGTWTGQDGSAQETAALLTATGWATAIARHGDDIAEVWQRTGRVEAAV